LWLLRVLAFRLMFSSGAVKLLSGDASWWGLTALTVHYETQPIPNALAWYVHQLPPWSHALATLQMFAIELAAPFLIFFVTMPRVRLAAAVLLGGLQLVIAATGNYGFFNLLSCALCVLIVDDAQLPARWRRGPVEGGRQWPRPILVAVAVVVGALSLVQAGATLRLVRRLPVPLATVYSWASPFRIVNGYGLFAVMTTTRPDIVLEGSEDGERWLTYEFRYKPGDVKRAPPQVAPHMPRLDWQMWFAALDRWDGSSWFGAFEASLLQARPAALSLLARDPFDGRRPRYVRARLYRYRFSGGAEAKDGAWWVREDLGPYGPTLSQ
jgi:lipase maturation factor 1